MNNSNYVLLVREQCGKIIDEIGLIDSDIVIELKEVVEDISTKEEKGITDFSGMDTSYFTKAFHSENIENRSNILIELRELNRLIGMSEDKVKSMNSTAEKPVGKERLRMNKLRKVSFNIHTLLFIIIAVLNIVSYFHFPNWGERSGDDFIPLIVSFIIWFILVSIGIPAFLFPKGAIDKELNNTIKKGAIIFSALGSAIEDGKYASTSLHIGDNAKNIVIKRTINPLVESVLTFFISMFAIMSFEAKIDYYSIILICITSSLYLMSICSVIWDYTSERSILAPIKSFRNRILIIGLFPIIANMILKFVS